MRFLLFPSLCLLALLAVSPFARAQSMVFHCIGAHGEPVFSGQPCGDPAGPPMTLGGKDDKQGVSGAFAGGVCARSPGQLRQSIAAAFASRDVNRLAGLILWRGMGQSSARDTLRALSAWLKQPLVGIAGDYPDAAPQPDGEAPPFAPTDAAVVPPSAGEAQVPSAFRVSTGGPDGRTRDFGVTRFGGCWWLTF